jgi:hypothetical protein
VLAYLTDLEGQWEKLESFVRDTPCLHLDARGVLTVSAGARFVFGGDAIDRGPAARRIVATLLDAHSRQPDRVVLLAGNRDINKMRLTRELAGFAPAKTPPELRTASPGALLPWIFAHTMGARAAFEHRRSERTLEGVSTDDEAVAASFLDDLSPDGALTRYLAAARLAYLDDGTLVVHGAVTDESLGYVPGEADPITSVAAWVDALNNFYTREFAAWRASITSPTGDEASPGRLLIEYQAPVPDTKLNQASVVYGRLTDETGNPRLPSPAVLDRLRRAGVARLLLGHTPSGDVPALLRDEGFTMVMADNSYGRVELGSRVHVTGARVRVRGDTVLDDGTHRVVSYDDDPSDTALGRRDAETGALLKARFEDGDYLAFRGLPDNKVEQQVVTASSLRARTLVTPRG